MSESVTEGSGDATPPSRLERRKARTRAALIKAAQSLLASGQMNVPVLEITQAADVGMGSFYNHFQSKEELFEAAVAEVIERHGALLDQLTAGIEDPALAFATSFRLTGRLHRRVPEMSRILLHSALDLFSADAGLAPRARRDIQAGIDAGRFTVSDADLALVSAAGATICLGQFLHDHPDRDDAEATDQVAEDLLRLFGLTARQAHKLCTQELPALDLAAIAGAWA